MISNNFNTHTFHVPVMGLGFTIDTPIKVAHFGISSVISLVDDILIEKMREHYSKLYLINFEPISAKIDDYRAKRITAYLDLVNDIVKDNFNKLKNSRYQKGSDLEKYFDLLPDSAILKRNFLKVLNSNLSENDLQNWIYENLEMGSIDVNIMTKLDKENYKNKELLPVEFNDAHSALRGFANSKLESSIVLSAGINTRLYSYFEKFRDFYPDEKGTLKKKIILKISDYRSAFIQGKIFAKKGLWVSEYRLESGLNCGGHAFATDGYLMGPILDELKNNRNLLKDTTFNLISRAFKEKNIDIPEKAFDLKITAQGGVGTFKEHNFLLEHFNLDSIGWGTPFLLVPEVTNVDENTRNLLSDATEDDLYLSSISPLGIPFNSLKGNTKDIEKENLIEKNRPGSSCPEKYCSLNSEYTEQTICTASRQYQNIKINELNTKDLDAFDYKLVFDKIVEKACLCVGLSTSALLVNDISTAKNGNGVSVCPGPNMAYFSEIVSLKKMVDHIYGKINIMRRKDRPNLFIKELGLYIEYFKNLTDSISVHSSEIQKKHLSNFRNNINSGISYYKNLFADFHTNFEEMKSVILSQLDAFEIEFNNISIEHIFSEAV